MKEMGLRDAMCGADNVNETCQKPAPVDEGLRVVSDDGDIMDESSGRQPAEPSHVSSMSVC